MTPDLILSCMYDVFGGYFANICFFVVHKWSQSFIKVWNVKSYFDFGCSFPDIFSPANSVMKC